MRRRREELVYFPSRREKPLRCPWIFSLPRSHPASLGSSCPCVGQDRFRLRASILAVCRLGHPSFRPSQGSLQKEKIATSSERPPPMPSSPTQVPTLGPPPIHLHYFLHSLTVYLVSALFVSTHSDANSSQDSLMHRCFHEHLAQGLTPSRPQ